MFLAACPLISQPLSALCLISSWWHHDTSEFFTLFFWGLYQTLTVLKWMSDLSTCPSFLFLEKVSVEPVSLVLLEFDFIAKSRFTLLWFCVFLPPLLRRVYKIKPWLLLVGIVKYFGTLHSLFWLIRPLPRTIGTALIKIWQFCRHPSSWRGN